MGQQGSYKLIVDGDGVQDLAGNVGSGEASASWIMETTPPDAPTNVALTPDRGASDSDGVTNTEQVSITGSVDAPGLNVRVYDDTTGHEIGFAPADGLTFSVPVDLGAVGNHVLWVNAVDAAGNVSGNAVLNAFIDETPPTVEQVNGVPAAPTTSPVERPRHRLLQDDQPGHPRCPGPDADLERRPEPDQRRSLLQPGLRHDVSHRRPDRPDLGARFLPALARSHEGPGHRRQRGTGPVHGLVDGDPRGHDASDQRGHVADDGQHVRLHRAVVGAGQSGRQRHRVLRRVLERGWRPVHPLAIPHHADLGDVPGLGPAHLRLLQHRDRHRRQPGTDEERRGRLDLRVDPGIDPRHGLRRRQPGRDRHGRRRERPARLDGLPRPGQRRAARPRRSVRRQRRPTALSPSRTSSRAPTPSARSCSPDGN